MRVDLVGGHCTEVLCAATSELGNSSSYSVCAVIDIIYLPKVSTIYGNSHLTGQCA